MRLLAPFTCSAGLVLSCFVPILPASSLQLANAKQLARNDSPLAEGVDQYIVPSVFNAEGSEATAGAIGALTLALDEYEKRHGAHAAAAATSSKL